MRLTSRLSFMTVATALATFVATFGVTTVATTTQASAVDPNCTGVCFWDAYTNDGSNSDRPYHPAGSRADETKPLTQFGSKPQNIPVAGIRGVDIKGKISYFANSHYANGKSLNDTVSYLSNNTGDCLMVFDDRNYGAGLARVAIIFGPHSNFALANSLVGANNKISSAVLIPRNAPTCIIRDEQSHFSVL